MLVVDPGIPETWQGDLAEEVSRLVSLCRLEPANHGERSSYDLSLGSFSLDSEVERNFRELLGARKIALYHASRMLPHELEALAAEGLVVLSEEHRGARLDRVIENYGGTIGRDRLEKLRHAGPLGWNRSHREGRLGIFHAVTPIDAFEWDDWGLTPFLENWGGESFYWAQEDSPVYADTIFELTTLSEPIIVEVAVNANELCNYNYLWRIFVAQTGGWPEPWHEFSSSKSVPPTHVVEIISEKSPRWPY